MWLVELNTPHPHTHAMLSPTCSGSNSSFSKILLWGQHSLTQWCLWLPASLQSMCTVELPSPLGSKQSAGSSNVPIHVPCLLGMHYANTSFKVNSKEGIWEAAFSQIRMDAWDSPWKPGSQALSAKGHVSGGSQHRPQAVHPPGWARCRWPHTAGAHTRALSSVHTLFLSVSEMLEEDGEKRDLSCDVRGLKGWPSSGTCRSLEHRHPQQDRPSQVSGRWYFLKTDVYFVCKINTT